jgi:hypothetical protein
MAKIAIKDLEKNQELDKAAMKNLRGGMWITSSSSMGAWMTPWGGGGYSTSSTSWGTGWGGWNPWGGGWGGNPWGGGWGNPWGPW